MWYDYFDDGYQHNKDYDNDDYDNNKDCLLERVHSCRSFTVCIKNYNGKKE